MMKEREIPAEWFDLQESNMLPVVRFNGGEQMTIEPAVFKAESKEVTLIHHNII
jgi:hypothetical protein